MLRDESVAIEPVWTNDTSGSSEPHREIDRRLRTLALAKTRLKVEEARWLREAEQHRIWRKLGFSTVLEYLEDVFDYAPRTAKDRLRVAKELGELPGLEEEMRKGELSYTAARELTRVMTPANESAWLERVRGLKGEAIGQLVSGRRKGDTPDAPTDPALMVRNVVFRLDPRRDALLQQTRALLEAERGAYLEPEELLEALCMRALEGGAVLSEKPPKPAHKIVIHKCECSRSWLEARGKRVEINDADRERAECDAEVTHQEDLASAIANGTRKPNATLTIPKKTRELVWARDQGRCRFPGCRATRNIEIHHLQFQSHGGGHEPWNTALLCFGHHQSLHEGIVSVTGRADRELVFMRDGKRLVDSRSTNELRAAQGLTPKAEPRNRFTEVVGVQ